MSFLPLLASLAVATSTPESTWVDVDRDGRLDLFVRDVENGDRLLVARGDGGFVDRLAEAGLAGRRGSRLAVWADYDADGWPDLYRVGAQGSGEVWRNMRDGTFAPVGDFVGVPALRDVVDAKWLDADGDGSLDLALWTGSSLVVARGNGDGTFAAATVAGAGFEALEDPTVRRLAGAGPDEPETEVGAAAAPVGPSFTITPGGASGRAAAGALPNCPVALDDQGSFGNCLQASSSPTLGMLYPLSSELFVTPGGNVGVGTTAPADRLDVAGTVEADGLRLPNGASQGRFLMTDNAGNASWQPVPITGLTGGGTTSFVPMYTSPGTLGDSSIQQTGSGAAIGTPSPFASLGLAGDALDRALRLIGSGAGGSAARLLFGSDDDDTYIAETEEDGLYVVAPAGVGIGPGNLGIHVAGFWEATHALTVAPGSPSDQDIARLIGPLGNFGHGARLSFGDANFVTLEEDEDDRLRIQARKGTKATTDGTQAVPALQVEQTAGFGTSSPALNVQNTSTGQGIGIFSQTWGTDANAVLTHYGTGSIIKAFASGLVFEVRNDGRVVCKELEITGGADLAEPFDTDEPVEPGSVVVIDPDEPGSLRESSEAYDTRVAGVVSGAGGIRPGVSLRQEGVAEGGTPVALTGRVYVRCSAENGPVRPGDLLTTAATAGHAMRASDPERSFGAVLGKAMGSLDEGTGLVLTLVNLQ